MISSIFRATLFFVLTTATTVINRLFALDVSSENGINWEKILDSIWAHWLLFVVICHFFFTLVYAFLEYKFRNNVLEKEKIKFLEDLRKIAADQFNNNQGYTTDDYIKDYGKAIKIISGGKAK